jgi:hypothetical protein
VLPDDRDGPGHLADQDVRWMDQRLADFANGLDTELRGVLGERLHAGPPDRVTVGSALFRLMLLHELRKVGVLTYDEFQGLKARLLGL